MKNELHELFQLAAKFFIKRYKKEGGAQSKLAYELGITQSYLSSVVSGSRSASLGLYSQIAEKLYGPLDKFLAVGRRIKEGQDPLVEKGKIPEDQVESLIARLTYYVVDHQRIENEISELKQFYEMIVENQPFGIVVTCKDHKIIFLNNYLKSLTLIVSGEELMGKTPYDVEKNIPGLDIGTLRDKYHEAFEKQQKLNFNNISVKSSNGEINFFSGALIPVIQNGFFNGMLCTIFNSSQSHILRKLLFNTLNYITHDIGVGVVQQISPGEQPKVYFKNKQFDEIFGIEDIDPSKVPITDTVKLMASRMKNSKKWLEHVKKTITTNAVDVKTVITMKNNKKYEWHSNPLIDELGYQWGRIILVK
jgi:transcriptional regulator with XRE-family HTH domain